MIEEKRLLISDHCVEDDEFVVEITKKLEQFVEVMLGKGKVDSVEFSIEPWYIEEPEFNVNAEIKIQFNEYKYLNEYINEIRTESIVMVLEDKGFQAFWIDGKFVKKFVYEWCQGCPIQKHDKIYGIDKNELYDKFNEFILTC